MRPPVPATPSFGVKYRDSFHSLPAFLPPAELLADLAPPMTVDVPISGPITLERISEGDLEIVRSRRDMALASRRRLIAAAAGLAVTLLLVAVAFLRG